MSLFKVFDIAGSALSAQTTRLNTTASNLANAESASSSTEATYRARHPVFQAVLDANNAPTGQVRVAGIVESQAPLHKQYDPSNPLADKDGYVHLPNVNLVEEMANMMSASRSFQSNTEMINTAKQLAQKTLQLGQ